VLAICDQGSAFEEIDEACRVHAEKATASYARDEEGIKQEILEQFGSLRSVVMDASEIERTNNSLTSSKPAVLIKRIMIGKDSY